ncbi:DUF6884 domain-containing protein [Prauserella flavalba]|uniref:Permease n=1 Tax=Prauserella flavalba TaxID=1477506 RepID=A0A318L9A3_9PSEU|nr:DUF6884 domain-containing protein [Prauserella flavalba]PXY16646.1 permease [Prauserella flavalba]
MTSHQRPTRVLLPDEGLIILNCSRSKLVTSSPIPALELYQGGCIPHARAHFANNPVLRARIRILSAAHGLLRPDDPISTYDRRLRTRADALRLHEQTVSGQLEAELADTRALRHLLIIVEPLYLLALQHVFDRPDRLEHLAVVTTPWGWQDGLEHLRRWGWA